MEVTKRIRRWIGALVLIQGVLGGAEVAAQGFDPVLYELREGSYLVDDCLCGRPALMVPLRGTMVLERLPVRIAGEVYAIREILFAPVDPSTGKTYTVRGGGELWRTGAGMEEMRIDLELEVGDTAGVLLTGEKKGDDGLWPTFEIDAGESGERDMWNVYSLHIEAAPAAEMVRYELVTDGIEGSYFVDDCIPCGRPTIPIPIAGTFLLGEIHPGPNPIDTYRVDAIDFRGEAHGLEVQITGAGLYRQGGEVGLTQQIVLDLRVEGQREGHLESDVVGVEERWPAIAIGAEESDPPDELSVWSIRIVARPVEPGADDLFRRADANADGSVNIADPIYTLQWHFSGGPPPPCLESSDANGDGSADVSDPMYALLYLFRNGPPPPPPGPIDCGAAPEPVLGCERYPPCDTAVDPAGG